MKAEILAEGSTSGQDGSNDFGWMFTRCFFFFYPLQDTLLSKMHLIMYRFDLVVMIVRLLVYVHLGDA